MHKTRTGRTQSPLDNTYYLLHHLSFIFDKELDAVLKEQTGIGITQFKVLSVLESWPYSQQRSIAKILGLDESGVSRHVVALVRGGFVQKESHPSDGRQQLIVLSAKGSAILEQAQTIRDSVSRRLLSTLPAAEQKQFHSLLQRLHRRACTPESGCEQYIR